MHTPPACAITHSNPTTENVKTRRKAGLNVLSNLYTKDATFSGQQRGDYSSFSSNSATPSVRGRDWRIKLCDVLGDNDLAAGFRFNHLACISIIIAPALGNVLALYKSLELMSPCQ